MEIKLSKKEVGAVYFFNSLLDFYFYLFIIFSADLYQLSFAFLFDILSSPM